MNAATAMLAVTSAGTFLTGVAAWVAFRAYSRSTSPVLVAEFFARDDGTSRPVMWLSVRNIGQGIAWRVSARCRGLGIIVPDPPPQEIPRFWPGPVTHEDFILPGCEMQLPLDQSVAWSDVFAADGSARVRIRAARGPFRIRRTLTRQRVIRPVGTSRSAELWSQPDPLLEELKALRGAIEQIADRRSIPRNEEAA